MTITPEPIGHRGDCRGSGRQHRRIIDRRRPTSCPTVLIESTKPTRSPLPVLSRGPVDPATGDDRGVVVDASLLPPFPTIEHVVCKDAESQPAIRLGETVILRGHHLDGSGAVVSFAHPLVDVPRVVNVGANPTGSAIEVNAAPFERGSVLPRWPILLDSRPDVHHTRHINERMRKRHDGARAVEVI